MQVREQYKIVDVASNTSDIVFHGKLIGGFLAKTSGTITIKDHNDNTIIDAFPVTAGNSTPLPIIMPGQQGTITSAGGASGYLLV